jgi:hypothetical protein
MATAATQVGCALVVCSSGQSIAYCRFDHNGNILNSSATQANGGNPIINPPFPTSLCSACTNLNQNVRTNAQAVNVQVPNSDTSNGYSFLNDTTAMAIVFTSLGVACVALIVSIIVVVLFLRAKKTRRNGMGENNNDPHYIKESYY